MSIHKAPQPAILKVFDWKQLIGAVTLHLFPSRKHITVVLYKLAVCWVLGEELNYMEWAECSVHLCCHKKKKQSYKSKIGRNLGVTGQRLYPSLNYFLIIVDTVIWTKPSGCFLIRSIISSAFKLLWNSGGPALPVSGSSDTDHSQTDLTVRRCLTLEHLSKKKKTYLHINNCEGYWPSRLALPTNHHCVDKGWGGGDIYICMTSRMQMHFSASTIRGCSPFTAHGLRTVWHSNLLTLEVWSAVYAAQASGSESTCLICCRSFRAWDWFVCETIKATGSNGEGKLVPLGGPIYLSTQRTDRNSRCFCQLLEPKIEARVNPE